MSLSSCYDENFFDINAEMLTLDTKVIAPRVSR